MPAPSTTPRDLRLDRPPSTAAAAAGPSIAACIPASSTPALLRVRRAKRAGPVGCCRLLRARTARRTCPPVFVDRERCRGGNPIQQSCIRCQNASNRTSARSKARSWITYFKDRPRTSDAPSAQRASAAGRRRRQRAGERSEGRGQDGHSSASPAQCNDSIGPFFFHRACCPTSAHRSRSVLTTSYSKLHPRTGDRLIAKRASRQARRQPPAASAANQGRLDASLRWCRGGSGP